jgi:hypothetical protein
MPATIPPAGSSRNPNPYDMNNVSSVLTYPASPPGPP